MDFEYDVQPLELIAQNLFPDYQQEVMECLQRQEVTLWPVGRKKRGTTPFTLGSRTSSAGSRENSPRVEKQPQWRALEAARKAAAEERKIRKKLEAQIAAEKAAKEMASPGPSPPQLDYGTAARPSVAAMSSPRPATPFPTFTSFGGLGDIPSKPKVPLVPVVEANSSTTSESPEPVTGRRSGLYDEDQELCPICDRTGHRTFRNCPEFRKMMEEGFDRAIKGYLQDQTLPPLSERRQEKQPEGSGSGGIQPPPPPKVSGKGDPGDGSSSSSSSSSDSHSVKPSDSDSSSSDSDTPPSHLTKEER